MNALNETSSLSIDITESTRSSLIWLSFFFKHVYLLVLVIIGCIGNGFVIIIFGRRALRSSSGSMGSQTSVYPFLFYMAISDTLYLWILFGLWLTNYINVLHHQGICQLTLYLSYVCNFINAYYTIAFTSQRLFAVVRPFRVSHYLSWRRSRRLALVIILIACLIYGYIPFLTAIVDGRCFSLKESRWINEMMDIIDAVLVFLIPYLLIISMNMLILLSLRRHTTQHNEILFSNRFPVNTIREMTRRHTSRKMTQFLLTVSTSYLIVCAPYACIHTLRLLKVTPATANFLRIEYYFLSLYHMSFAMNFYIYILFGSKFRREFQRFLFKCRIDLYRCLRFTHLYTETVDDDEDFHLRSPSSHCGARLSLEQYSTCPTLISLSPLTLPYRWKAYM